MQAKRRLCNDLLHKCLMLVARTGLSPLAARPAPPLSMASFAANIYEIKLYTRQSVLLSQNGSYPQTPLYTRYTTNTG